MSHNFIAVAICFKLDHLMFGFPALLLIMLLTLVLQVPKLLYRDGMQCLPTESSGSAQGFAEKWIRSRLSVYSPENVLLSSLGLDKNKSSADDRTHSGAFGFLRMVDLSAAEISFLSKASSLERCLFALLRSGESSSEDCPGDISKATLLDMPNVNHNGERSCGEGERRNFLDVFDDDEGEDLKTRAVRRMLILPSRSELVLLRAKHPSGPKWQPFEALAISHQERLLGSTGLLRSVRKYMPPVRAPQVHHPLLRDFVLCPVSLLLFTRCRLPLNDTAIAYQVCTLFLFLSKCFSEGCL